MKPNKLSSKVVALSLVTLTASGIAFFPAIKQALAKTMPHDEILLPNQKHQIEVVFILDTTSSMSGLIQAAKEKIWSIASTMASAQQNPDIKMGLVAFRDRGDAYVTRTFDLSDDLDSMYTHLMDLRAEGGGDTPESVNQALFEAIHNISWSQGDHVYRVAFLVGDAPPHMDYHNDVKFPETLEVATEKGIVVNAIQSGRYDYTRPSWQRIASLGNGTYFQVEDSGNAVAVATPFDEKLSALATKLEQTRLYFGDAEAKKIQQSKIDANKKLRDELSKEALARRAAFNVTASGKKNFLGESELVDAVTSGKVSLEEIDRKDLPASLQSMAPSEQMKVIAEQAQRRKDLEQEIKTLSASRSRFIKRKVEEAEGADDSLDEKIYRAVRNQAASVGLSYDRDTANY